MGDIGKGFFEVYGILGVAGRSGAEASFARACSWLAGTERGPVTAVPTGSEQLFLGTTGSGGAVLGKARDGDRSLVYLGSIYRPFPGWEEGSPLDDPDRTAAVLLQRFAQSELAFLDGVQGNFVAVVAEPGGRRVVIARPPQSTQRVFVTGGDDGLLFSTRLLDFRGLLGDRWELDRSLEDFLLGYEFLPFGRTPYKEVTSLDAGKILVWRDGSLASHEIPARPEASAEAPELTNLKQVVPALHAAFQQSIQGLLPSDDKVAVMLGGFDSALIAATLIGLGKQVETFSFHYQEPGYDQNLVDELARHLGIRHHWVPVTPQVLQEGIDHFAQRFNQPVGQAHYVIATAHLAAEMGRRGFRHCLTGDGCDGLFLGYPTVAFRAKLIGRLARLGPLLSGPLGLATGSIWLEKRLGHPYRIARNVANILRRPMPQRGHIAACTLDRIALDALRGDAPPQAMDPEQVLEQLAAGLEQVNPTRLAYLGKGRVGLNAAKLEGASSFSGVTLNSPYMHPAMVALASRIPDALYRPQESTRSEATGKYAFMRMAEQYELLPAKFIYQHKQSPVTAPVDYWAWGPLHERLLQRLDQLPFDCDRDYAASLVTPKSSEKWFREHVGISRFVTPAIHLLATYASFTERVGHTGPKL